MFRNRFALAVLCAAVCAAGAWWSLSAGPKRTPTVRLGLVGADYAERAVLALCAGSGRRTVYRWEAAQDAGEPMPRTVLYDPATGELLEMVTGPSEVQAHRIPQGDLRALYSRAATTPTSFTTAAAAVSRPSR